jgi:hypothetical protein
MLRMSRVGEMVGGGADLLISLLPLVGSFAMRMMGFPLP